MSLALVRHPDVRAVGFTGSLRAGRALFDAAAARPEPIPVYAEMGSVNPLFVLPGALKERGEAIAEGLAGSVTLGAGQFCTNPGVVVGLEGEALTKLADSTGRRLAEMPAFTMLYENVRAGYAEGVEAVGSTAGVEVAGRAEGGNGSATPRPRRRLRHRCGDVSEAGAPPRRGVRPVYDYRALSVQRAPGGRCARAGGQPYRHHPRHGGRPPRARRSCPDSPSESRTSHLQRLPDGRRGVPVDEPRRPVSCHHGRPLDVRWGRRPSTALPARSATRASRQEALPPQLRDQNEHGLLRMVNGGYTREDVG